MREIKFRAWNTDKEKMDYGDHGDFGLSASVICPLKTIPNRNGTYRTELGECFNGILLQYTGLLDKNGKEIFEGDIVMLYSYPYSKIKKGIKVCWENNGFYPFNQHDEEYGSPLDGQWCEIIGNIYENPNLLSNPQ